MTPAVSRNNHESTTEDERARAEMDNTSGISPFSSNGDHEHHNKGFMANTLSRRFTALGGKIRDRGESNSTTAALGDESEDSNRRKSKLLLGKKILGGLTDR